ncbi:MAG: glycosyltransferase family 2 protein [Lachnospiraceae bacterium]|nr:glycosyltransferase family 2 protein [Lachnospiraceae bacterium]
MVSVIVPVYKSEKTLERCVKSLTMQSYKDLEILLVVDGPPDQSGELAEKLAGEDNRIRVINQKNQGVSAARNKGLKEAKGTYIRFLDSDDYVEKDSIQILVEAMEAGDTDFVVAGFHHLYFGRCIEKLPEQEGIFRVEESKDFIWKLYGAGFFHMPWNKLFKREMIKTGFPEDLNLGEDLLFNLAYLKGCKHFSTVKKPVCEFIQDDRGTTLSTKKRKDKLEIALLLYERTGQAMEALFGDCRTEGVLENKLIVEFLDDLEQLAFADSMTMKEKLRIIDDYKNALKKLKKEHPEHKVRLELLDYKIIYFFLNIGCRHMTYLMIVLRGFVVRLLKRR